MMLRSSLFCGLHQRYWFQSEGERTRNSSATCLMFGHLVRVTCHEILSFGRRPYRDVKPKLGKG